jgi:hypothetical protein
MRHTGSPEAQDSTICGRKVQAVKSLLLKSQRYMGAEKSAAWSHREDMLVRGGWLGGIIIR